MRVLGLEELVHDAFRAAVEEESWGDVGFCFSRGCVYGPRLRVSPVYPFASSLYFLALG